MSLLESALEYHAQGFCVIPLQPEGKKPLFDWKEFQKTRSTEAQIRQWWKENPIANIGIVCGRVSENLVVVDCDSNEAFEKLFSKEKQETLLKNTLVVKTGKGNHVHFRTKKPTSTFRFRPKLDVPIDLQGEGALVVAPPSIHPSGKEYRRISEATAPQLVEGDFKEQLFRDVEEKFQVKLDSQREVVCVEALLEGVSEGGRNDAAIKAATYFRIKGMDEKQAISALKEWNSKNKPPLPEKDILAVVKSAYREEKPYGYRFDVFERRKESLELLFPTAHLVNFNALDYCMGLIGPEYALHKKGAWYFMHGMAARKTYSPDELMTEKTEENAPLIIRLGKICCDTRFHFGLCVPSGFGKKNFAEFIRYCANQLHISIGAPTSFHPEQFVGKIVLVNEYVETNKLNKDGTPKMKRVQTPTPLRGYFDDAAIVIDEGLALIQETRPEYEETSKHFRIATDAYGQNQVEKRMVDFGNTCPLKYYAKPSIALFFQPYPIEEQCVIDGLLRRFRIVYVSMALEGRKPDFEARLSQGTDFEEQNYRAILQKHLETVKGIAQTGARIVFEKEAEKELVALSETHYSYVSSLGGKRGRFAAMRGYSIQNDLASMAALQALSHYRTKVIAEDVEKAFVDLFELDLSTLDFVHAKIKGELDYGESWGGAKGKARNCLEFLAEKDAFSCDKSTVSIKDFIKKIAEVYDVSEETARGKLTWFKNRCWVESKQLGQYDSRLWLAVKPPNLRLGSRQTTALTKYAELAKKYSSGSNPPSPCAPSTKPEDGPCISETIQGGQGGEDARGVRGEKIIQSVKTQIINALSHEFEPVSEAALVLRVKEAGLNPELITNALAELSKEGVLAENPHGYWSLVRKNGVLGDTDEATEVE